MSTPVPGEGTPELGEPPLYVPPVTEPEPNVEPPTEVTEPPSLPDPIDPVEAALRARNNA